MNQCCKVSVLLACLLTIIASPLDLRAAAKPLVSPSAQDWDPDFISTMMKFSLTGINRVNYALWVADNVPDAAKKTELLKKIFEQDGGAAEKIFDALWGQMSKANPSYFNMIAMVKFFQHPEKYENWDFFVKELPIYESTVKLLKEELYTTMDELNRVDKGTWKLWIEAAEKLKKDYPAVIKAFEVVGKTLDGEYQRAFEEKLKDPQFRQTLEEALTKLQENPKFKEWLGKNPANKKLADDYINRYREYLRGFRPDEKGNWLFDGETETIWHKLYRWRYGIRLRLSMGQVPGFDGKGALADRPLSPDQLLVRDLSAALFQWDFGCWPNVSSTDIVKMLEIVAEQSPLPKARSFAQQQRQMIQQRFPERPERPNIAAELVLGEARPSRFSVSQKVVLDSPTRQIFALSVPYRFAQEYRPGLKGAALVVALTEGTDWVFVDVNANQRVPGNSALIDRTTGEKVLAELRTSRMLPDDSGRLARSEGRANWLDDSGAVARVEPAPEWFQYGFGSKKENSKEDAARVYLHVNSLPGIWTEANRSVTIRCAWSVQPIALAYQSIPDKSGTIQHVFRFVLPLCRKVEDVDQDARFYVYRAPRPAAGQQPNWENLTESGLQLDPSLLTAQHNDPPSIERPPLLLASADAAQGFRLAQAEKKDLKAIDRPFTFAINKDGVIECMYRATAGKQAGPYIYIAEQHYTWQSPASKAKPRLELHR